MLKDTFCSSPWYHIRINPLGYYIPCRWAPEWLPSHQTSDYNITNYSISDYMNSDVMKNFRMKKLNGDQDSMCTHCYQEDNANKLSGRHRQLLKSAITVDNFDKTLSASPHWPWFEQSLNNNGYTNNMPVDLQIDLGNICNSSCIMCNPTYSSKLASEYKNLIKIEPEIFPRYPTAKNWTDDPALLDKFINELITQPNIKYIHFLGGETLYLKSFYKICHALIDNGLSENIILGTTTNATVYSQELVDIIKNFKQVHLGISLETVDKLNDYIRYPSKINLVLQNIQNFLNLKIDSKLYISLRITPSVYSIYKIDEMFEYMIKNKLTMESCNILTDPSCLRIELLPNSLRQNIIDKITAVIKRYDIQPAEQILNRRSQDLNQSVISNNIYEYLELLKNLTEPADLEKQRIDLVKFTKAFESLHNNCILDHLPEYEEFLRSYGY